MQSCLKIARSTQAKSSKNQSLETLRSEKEGHSRFFRFVFIKNDKSSTPVKC